jgi:hypothetical protein
VISSIKYSVLQEVNDMISLLLVVSDPQQPDLKGDRSDPLYYSGFGRRRYSKVNYFLKTSLTLFLRNMLLTVQLFNYLMIFL